MLERSIGRENSSTARGRHANNYTGSQLRQRLNRLKDQYWHSDRGYDPASANAPVHKNELSPSDATPPLSVLKEESQMLADARDLSAIKPSEQQFTQRQILEPEQYDRDAYEAYDVMFKPLSTKDDQKAKFDEFGAHPKANIISEPQSGFHVARDESRAKSDNRAYKQDAEATGLEFEHKARDGHLREYNPPAHSSTVTHEPRHYNIDRSNVMINYRPTQTPPVEAKRMIVSQPQIENLLDKSKSSDYELQPALTQLVQRGSRDDAEVGIERSQTKTETTAEPMRQRAPYQQTEARRFVNQKTKRNTLAVPKPIITQHKRPVNITQARSYNYTQRHRENHKEADTNKRLTDAEETVRALREELSRKDAEVAVLNNSMIGSKREIELIKDELSRTRLENANAISSRRKSDDRVDELSSQLDAARLRLQSTSDKFGRVIDYIYRLNEEKHLKVLEDIVGTKGRTDLDDVYKKNEELKRKLADMTDLMYMSRDRNLIEKLEELYKRK